MLTLADASSQRGTNRRGPVRVCFFIDRLGRAGTETQLLALIRSLDRSRVRPHLVLFNGEDAESRSLEPVDCPILRLGLNSILSVATWRALARLRRFWRQNRIDIVQTYFLDSTYLGIPFAKFCGIRKILRVRNNLGYWLTGGHRRLGNCMGRLADLTLTNSEEGRRALINSEGLHPEKIAVLDNGVDLDRFPPGDPPFANESLMRVGVVANLRPVKNIDGLVHAAVRLLADRPQLVFEVAGEGEQRPALESLIREKGLEGRFRLIGAVADVPGFLAACDIAALPSHSEGMSNALLEYMAAGRAIVATDVGANPKLVAHGRHGLIVPAGDSAALGGAIGWLIDHPSEAAAMAQAARRKVEAQHSRRAMIERFTSLYEELLNRRRGMPPTDRTADELSRTCLPG